MGAHDACRVLGKWLLKVSGTDELSEITEGFSMVEGKSQYIKCLFIISILFVENQFR